ncbi:MAG: bifunctional phosphopantothenoylcysteine decarboxylase/phosphopantothenate--cysteine ligase CoaBC [bacterium]|nr:bifunctional phosphopantothenoylcysteine decarboxylase/phosphopantothenate--cysteine ligase CoaBC [bacterium]
MKSNRRPDRDARPAGELGGRRILLGVTGGIAAYKAVELARLFIQAGAKVQLIMTPAATKFVAPLTFEAITARTVFVEMFPEQGQESPWHTELSTWADIVVVAPATADHIGRVANGLGDDLLTTTLLACERRRVMCPSMNPRMWANPAVQENLNTLKRHGFRIINPEEGEMARPGEEHGVGRLAEPATIYAEVRHMLSAPQDLRNVKVLVTAGRTEESWDPVRVLTNRASGRMGFALAEEARERGADVSLVCGPTDVIPPSGVRLTRITTASQMAAAVKREFQYCNILLMSAAVSDYTFDKTAANKIKKGVADPEVNLVPTEDILKGISQNKGNRVIVGFALETENVLDNALRKLREKHLDVVVANNPLAQGSGFQVETNQVFIIHRNGSVTDLPLQSKREVAREILNAVMELYRNPLPEPDTDPELDLDLDLEPEDDYELPMDEGDDRGLVNLDGLDIEESHEEHAAPANGSAPKHGKVFAPQSKKQKRPQQQPSKPQPQAQAKPQTQPQAKVEPPAQPQPKPQAAPQVKPKPEAQAQQPAPQAGQAGQGKKKSRRGGRRVRERRERLAALAAQQTGQAPQHGETTPVVSTSTRRCRTSFIGSEGDQEEEG